jgi:hypothetical protein
MFKIYVNISSVTVWTLGVTAKNRMKPSKNETVWRYKFLLFFNVK